MSFRVVLGNEPDIRREKVEGEIWSPNPRRVDSDQEEPFGLTFAVVGVDCCYDPRIHGGFPWHRDVASLFVSRLVQRADGLDAAGRLLATDSAVTGQVEHRFWVSYC